MSQVDNADSAPAEDDIADSSPETVEEETLEAQEGEAPALTENAQKRFDQITAEKREALEREAARDAENAELKARLERIESRGVSLDYEDPGAPKLEDFEDELEYASAKGEYLATKKIATLMTQSEQRRAEEIRQREFQGKVEGYNQKLSSVKSSLTDFDTVTASGELQQVDAAGNPSFAVQAILEMEHGPEAFYHIQSNPQLARQINSSSPVQASILIKQVSDQFAAGSQIEPPPPPVESEGGGNGLAVADDGKKYSRGAKFY